MKNKNTIELKVITSGNCLFCKRPIRLVVSRGNNKFPDVFVCDQCALKMKGENK